MKKITVRIPTEQYAYIELEYESKEDYVENYPSDAIAIKATRAKVKEAIESKPPFEDNVKVEGKYSSK